MLAIGSIFPEFSLSDQNGATVSRESLTGKACVFIFYPGDMTPGCTLQLCAIRDEWQSFVALGIQVFGINHGGAASHKRFESAFRLPFPLLIDEHKRLSKTVGAIRTLFGITVIKRTVIGIDAEGIVRMIKPGMPKAADILKAMKPYGFFES